MGGDIGRSQLQELEMESGKLEGSLEENVLTLLCWSTEHHLTVRNKIGAASAFTLTAFAQIAEVAVDYIDRYKAPPRRALEELLEAEIRARPLGLLAKTVEALEGYAQSLQPRYVLDNLDRFLRLSRLRMAVEGAAEALGAGDDVTAEELLINAGRDASLASYRTSPSRQPYQFRSELQKLWARDAIWGNIIQVGELTLILGRPRDGKSTLAQALAHTVSFGNDFLGMSTAPFSSCYLAYSEAQG